MPNEVDKQEVPDELKKIQEELGQDEKPDVKADEKADDALSTTEESETTANEDSSTSEEFDAQTSLQQIQAELEQTKKNYDELRSKATRDWQTASEQKRQFEQLQSSMESIVERLNNQAVEQVDPEQFMEDLRSQGPKALDKYLNPRFEALKESSEKTKTDKEKQDWIRDYETQFLRRAVNQNKYPGFAELEDKMNEIAGSQNCPVNLNQDVGVVLDSLYKLAKESSSENAVKKALNKGAEDERKRLAKEAKTAVAGSGAKKSSSAVPDLYNMPLEKLRDMLPKSEHRDYD